LPPRAEASGLSSAGLAGGGLLPAVGVGSVGDGFEEFFGELLVVVVEGCDGFEDEGEVVLGGAFVFVEDERVCAGVERECDVAQEGLWRSTVPDCQRCACRECCR